MISAGNTGVANPAAQQQQQVNPWAVNPWAMGPSFVTPNFQFPTYQMGGGNGGAKTNVNVKMNSKDGKAYLEKQAIFGAVNDCLGAGLNMMSAYFQYSLAGKSMDAQRDLGMQYYNTQLAMAGLQKEVASKQLDVQMAAVEAQKEMAKIDSDTAIALKKVGEKESTSLERIKQQGMTDRTKVAASAGMFSSASTDPFSRNGYFYG